MELESDSYDVVVIGTGLGESLAAASLAHSGKSVLHLDPNEYYGAEQASLTLDELSHWASTRSTTDPPPAEGSKTPSAYNGAQRRRYTHASTSALTPELQASRRQYALSLYPAILPSRGSLISTLITSGVSNYVGFRILDSVSVWKVPGEEGEGSVKRVPGSKEEVFKDKSIGLVDKRRLMKFLMFVAGKFEEDELLKGRETIPLPTFLSQSFSLPDHLCQEITYAIAHCSSPSEPTLPALRRARRYLQSIGRYGPSAFLVGQYGGAGEIAQGFCRACAVNGGTYILGAQADIESLDFAISDSDAPITIKLACHPRPISAKYLITTRDHLPPSTYPTAIASKPGEVIARCIAVLPAFPAVLKRPSNAEDEKAEDEDDTAVILFPPEGEMGLVRGLIMGEGTGSCPTGQFILYLSAVISAEADPAITLKPYLGRLASEPLFEAYYLSHDLQVESQEPSASSLPRGVVLLDAYNRQEMLTEGLDQEAEQGEKAFWAVMGDKESWAQGVKGWWEKDGEAGAEGEGEDEVELPGL